MSENILDKYWQTYFVSPTSTGGSYYYRSYHYYPSYYEPYCFFYHSSPSSKREAAFEIIKILVEEKIIPEPNYKTFVDLLEKIAEKI